MARFCGICENVADEYDKCLCDIEREREEESGKPNLKLDQEWEEQFMRDLPKFIRACHEMKNDLSNDDGYCGDCN